MITVLSGLIDVSWGLLYSYHLVYSCLLGIIYIYIYMYVHIITDRMGIACSTNLRNGLGEVTLEAITGWCFHRLLDAKQRDRYRHAHIYAYLHLFISAFIYIYRYIYIYTYFCLSICIYIGLFTCLSVYSNVQLCIV